MVNHYLWDQQSFSQFSGTHQSQQKYHITLCNPIYILGQIHLKIASKTPFSLIIWVEVKVEVFLGQCHQASSQKGEMVGICPNRGWKWPSNLPITTHTVKIVSSGVSSCVLGQWPLSHISIYFLNLLYKILFTLYFYINIIYSIEKF